jgi:hypothetical protein
MKYAVLIDGAFVRHKLRSSTEPTALNHVSAFLGRLIAHPSLSSLVLHRIYWYDSPPLEGTAKRPLHGGRIDLGGTQLARATKALLRGLATLPHVSIRRGDLVFRGWRIKRGRLPERQPTVTLAAADLEPNIQQKGVDMRIGLDIASLTMKQHVNVVVLVTGDSDFVPAMKFARREGAQLYLVTLTHPVRPEMLEHADLVLQIATERSQHRPEKEEEAHAA